MNEGENPQYKNIGLLAVSQNVNIVGSHLHSICGFVLFGRNIISNDNDFGEKLVREEGHRWEVVILGCTRLCRHSLNCNVLTNVREPFNRISFSFVVMTL